MTGGTELKPTVIELAIFGHENQLLHARAAVVDAGLRVARLVSDPDVDGYGKGDLVQYQHCQEYPFPLISARLESPPSADVIPLQKIHRR